MLIRGVCSGIMEIRCDVRTKRGSPTAMSGRTASGQSSDVTLERTKLRGVHTGRRRPIETDQNHSLMTTNNRELHSRLNPAVERRGLKVATLNQPDCGKR